MDSKFCNTCKAAKPITDFFKRSNGLPRTPCKRCYLDRANRLNGTKREFKREYNKQYHLKNRIHKNKLCSKRMKRGYLERLSYLNSIKKSTPCRDCGKFYQAELMDFDHCFGKKRLTLSLLAARNASYTTLNNELAKCQLRCSNCHRIKTFNERPRSKNTLSSWKNNRRTSNRILVNELKSKPCEHCRCCFSPYAMDFHHIDPSTKRYTIGYLLGRETSPKTILEEISRCQLLCSNCHRLEHLILKEKALAISYNEIESTDAGRQSVNLGS